MPELDEFDALLEEPFAEDVDWFAIDSLDRPSVREEASLPAVLNPPASYTSSVDLMHSLSPQTSSRLQAIQSAPVLSCEFLITSIFRFST
jgi:hypothetical protein